MGNFAPIFIAFILNCIDVFIFRPPKNYQICFPFGSYLIFLTGIFYLLWDIQINPFYEGFRKIFSWSNFILEFLIAKLILETSITDFWQPLQRYLVTVLPNTSDYLTYTMKSTHFDSSAICEVIKLLKWQGTLLFVNYAVSLFFMLILIHATRTVDFRLLRCGGDIFFKDVRKRSMKFLSKVIKLGRKYYRGETCRCHRNHHSRGRTHNQNRYNLEKHVHFEDDFSIGSENSCLMEVSNLQTSNHVHFDETQNGGSENSCVIDPCPSQSSNQSYCHCDSTGD